MNTIAIVVLVLSGLYLIAGIIFKKKLLVSKFLILIVFVAVGALVLSSQFGNDDEGSEIEIAEYYEKAPPPEYAPRVGSTITRTYFIAAQRDGYYFDVPNQDYITLTAFYYYDRKKWEYSDVPVPFKYNEIRIYDRS